MPPVIGRPVRRRTFRSSSKKTVIVYFTYRSGSTLAPFRGFVRVPRGYPDANVFICGLTLAARQQVDKLSRVSVTVNKYRYDPAQGQLEVGVNADLGSASGQPNWHEVTFVVVLSDPSVARFTQINGSCGGVGQCSIARNLAGVIPPGMQYIGLGTRSWELGSNDGALPLNALSGHIDALAVGPTDVTLDYLGAFRNAAESNRMYLEWAASVIAFTTSEMAQNTSPIFPQYTTGVGSVTTRQAWTNNDVAPAPIKGALSAFEGVTYLYPTGQEHEVWIVEASLGNVRIQPNTTNNVRTDWGIFLGTTFGDRQNSLQYDYQESRVLGFLL
jgi:hypothetical protein